MAASRETPALVSDCACALTEIASVISRQAIARGMSNPPGSQFTATSAAPHGKNPSQQLSAIATAAGIAISFARSAQHWHLRELAARLDETTTRRSSAVLAFHVLGEHLRRINGNEYSAAAGENFIFVVENLGGIDVSSSQLFDFSSLHA